MTRGQRLGRSGRGEDLHQARRESRRDRVLSDAADRRSTRRREEAVPLCLDALRTAPFLVM
jgi:hypothetical protein